jgi:hypothetical protein
MKRRKKSLHSAATTAAICKYSQVRWLDIIARRHFITSMNPAGKMFNTPEKLHRQQFANHPKEA